MTGVSVPMSREDIENLSRPLTGTEDVKGSAAYVQAEKSSAENEVSYSSVNQQRPKENMYKRVRSPNPSFKIHDKGKYKN